MIYFDNNATTAIDPAIARRMYDLQLQGLANPASQHRPGRLALKSLEQAKNSLLDALGAPNSGMETAQVIFTSGGTEANNLAVRGYAAIRPGLVIVAASEHSSLLDPARELGPDRCRVLPVDTHGRCDLQQLEDWLKADATRISLVSVMLGNNETGVIQDVRQICQLCLPYSVPVHSDAVQAIGKIPVDMRELGLSALSLTAHKLHGPVGIGALILLPGEKIAPMLLGGGQQLGLRPGTEPVVPAVALADAVGLSCQALSGGEYAIVAELRDRLETSLVALGNVEVIARQSERLPHVSNVAFLGLDRQAVQMALDLSGIACSTGSACASGSSRPSHVLTAMGLSPTLINGSIRFSLSRNTTAKEIDSAIELIARVLKKITC
ncbi:MAG: cysteine desulfurase [Planctomycetales bacterium]|nr:cysteine desulfurase [Planctomycetales bacterium]